MLGIVSNSDTRVASILRAFGILISPAMFPPRFAPSSRHVRPDFGPAHFAFATLSYHAGAAKPDPRIYNAAVVDAQRALDALHPVARLTRSGAKLLDNVNADFHHMHVGDELEKDVLPAIEAGWDAVLLDREAADPVGERVVGGKTVPVINSLDHLRELVTKERFEERFARLGAADKRRPVEARAVKGGKLFGRKLRPHPANREGENLMMIV